MTLTIYNKLETLRRFNILIKDTPQFFVLLQKSVGNHPDFRIYYRVFVENYQFGIIPNQCLVSFLGIYPSFKHVMTKIKYNIDNEKQILTITFNYQKKHYIEIKWLHIIFNLLKITLNHNLTSLVITLPPPIFTQNNLFWPTLYRYTDAGLRYTPLNYLLNIPDIDIYMTKVEIIKYLKGYVDMDSILINKWLSKIKANLIWDRIRPYYLIYHRIKNNKINSESFWCRFIKLETYLIINIFNYF